MNTNTFDDFDEESQEALRGMKFISFEDMQRGIVGRDPFADIRTNKTVKDISNEIALSTPFGKRSVFYKTTFVDQVVNFKTTFDVSIRVLVEDDAQYVKEQYQKETVADNTIKLYLVVKDESVINKGKQNDIRNANIRVSNISKFVGVVLGDKMFYLFNDYPEKMDKYIDKIAKDLIENDSQLSLVKKTLESKFNHYMQNRRTVLFPLGDIAQMIKNELKKDLQEFWKPILSSLANEIRALKIEDEKYWQPYTVQGKLKPDKDFAPLIGEKASDAQAYAANFLDCFKAIDKVLADYLNLNKIEDAKNLKPSPSSKLKIALARIYELFKAFFDFFKEGILSFIESLADQIYQLNAFLVGVINGVIEFVASLFDMMAFISGLLSGDAHVFWQAIKKAFKTLEEKGAFVYVFEALGKFFDAITKRYNTKQTKYKILKHLGEDLIGIVEFVLGAIVVLKTAKAVANASNKLYENLKKKVDDILGKHKDEFDGIENEKPFGGKGPLGKGIVIGKYSKRPFNPEKAGGPILDLDWRTVTIDKDGIDIVKKHLSRFNFDEWNERMINRLEAILKGEIKVSDFDKRFFSHETREFERYKSLGHENTKWKDLSEEEFEEIWNNTHSATLEDYKLYEIIEYDGRNVRSLYHPDVQY